ncbi:phosphopantetheine adenylyltransferase domain protein [Escherichia coli DEC2A]|nr:phosphopantetheine adenylyltransferase domain protein [Escherichia coli DEC2A]
MPDGMPSGADGEVSVAFRLCRMVCHPARINYFWHCRQ